MKKLFTLVIVSLITLTTFAQYPGRPFFPYSKHQKKNLKRFHSSKRHKRYIPYKNRAQVNHPSVKKFTAKTLKRKHWEDVTTLSK